MAKIGMTQGTLPDMPAVGYVEISQLWPGFDNDPEHEYPVGGDIGGHGRVVQHVVQRLAEQRGTSLLTLIGPVSQQRRLLIWPLGLKVGQYQVTVE